MFVVRQNECQKEKKKKERREGKGKSTDMINNRRASLTWNK